MRFSAVASRFDNRPKNAQFDWAKFVKFVNARTVRIGKTSEEVAAMESDARAKLKDKGGFIAAVFGGDGRRCKANVELRTAVTLDIDHLPEGSKFGTGDIERVFPGASYLLYSTFSSTPELPRYRVVIPHKELPVLEWEAVSRRVAERLGVLEYTDPASFRPAQVMYWTCRLLDKEPVILSHIGADLNTDEILKSYKDYRDLKSWPRSAEDKTALVPAGTTCADPRESKNAVIKAFCTKYSPIEDGIDALMPDVYTAADGTGNRYSYVPGHGRGGAVLYAGNDGVNMFLYSHHETDPAGDGHCHTIFDLFRIHCHGGDYNKALVAAAKDCGLYKGEQKEKPVEVEKPTPVVQPTQEEKPVEVVQPTQEEKPVEVVKPRTLAPAPKAQPIRLDVMDSEEGFDAEGLAAKTDFKQRCRLAALCKPEVLAELPDEVVQLKGLRGLKFKQVGEDVIPTVASTGGNIESILNGLRQFSGLFSLDTFTGEIVLTRTPEWRHERINRRTKILTQADRSFIYSFMSNYGISKDSLIDSCLLNTARGNAYHPIKAYIEGLTWDGVPRVETALLDFFGGTDTEYARCISKIFFMGCIQRLYVPGCQFDVMLTIKGDQGIGKTSFFRKLGGPWFSSGGIDLKNQYERAVQKLEQLWIFEFGELDGLSAAEANRIKGFVTSTQDVFRKAYAKDHTHSARHCVFVATTNDGDFLNDITGNRRFLIYDAAPAGEAPLSVKDDLTQAYVDQLWAEAYELDKAANFSAFLDVPDSLKEYADELRALHSQSDPLQDAIEEFLADNDRGEITPQDIWLDALDHADLKDYKKAFAVKCNKILENLKDDKGRKMYKKVRGRDPKTGRARRFMKRIRY